MDGWPRLIAKQGATVVVVGCDESKGATFVERSNDLAGTIAFHQADLASQSTVRSLATTVKREYDQIDVLAHNAGLSAGSRRESSDGIELTLAVNHLAPYLLTYELLDYLRDAPDPRVVITASDIHRRATLDLDDLQLTDGYDSLEAYARAKLANIAFTVELDDRLPEDSAVTVNCVHPGIRSHDGPVPRCVAPNAAAGSDRRAGSGCRHLKAGGRRTPPNASGGADVRLREWPIYRQRWPRRSRTRGNEPGGSTAALGNECRSGRHYTRLADV